MFLVIKTYVQSFTNINKSLEKRHIGKNKKQPLESITFINTQCAVKEQCILYKISALDNIV